MGINKAKTELAAAANDFAKVRNGLDVINHYYSRAHEKLGEVLVRTQITFPHHLAGATDDYEKATQH